jgi:nicotinate-nucleotide pyrophosphorylase (carboxylating)
MTKAVELINGSCESEASGGITREQLKDVAATGVTYISAGALTHSAENIDLSLKAIK